MVIVVFRSRLRPGIETQFKALGDKIQKIAESMPDFRSYQVYTTHDGARESIIEFGTMETLQAWRGEPDHQAAQQYGREHFYESYSLVVSEPLRESNFEMPS